MSKSFDLLVVGVCINKPYIVSGNNTDVDNEKVDNNIVAQQ